jgi:hypothetical protein
MENSDLHQDAPMNDFDPQDKERLENWKALQVALGLVPDEMPVPAPRAKEAPPPSPPQRAAAPPRFESSFQESAEALPAGAGESAEPFESNSNASSPEAAGAEQEVEVGEAPEEIPEEPSDEQTAPGEKRRRRRRRRRRRGAGETADDGAAKSEGLPDGAGPTAGEDDAADEEDDGAADEDEEEIEPLSIPDWNVPTWQELIASLYRPER